MARWAVLNTIIFTALSCHAEQLVVEEERLAREHNNASTCGREMPIQVLDDPYLEQAPKEDVMKLLNLNVPFTCPSMQKFSETPITWSPTHAQKVARNNRVKGAKRRPRR